MDGRQRSLTMKRVEPGRHCKAKVQSEESITREFVENELSDSKTSIVSPECLSSSLEDAKPLGLKIPSPDSRRRLFKEASPPSIRAFRPSSQDLNANSSREQEFSVPLRPLYAKFRIIRRVPTRPRSGLFRTRLPNLSLYRIDNGGPSIMEKVVRAERELEMEEHSRQLSNMDVTREVEIRQFYDKLPPSKQYIFKERMMRMGEQLPSAVLRAHPNVRPAPSDLHRITSPLFIPTSLLEKSRADSTLAEMQEEERDNPSQLSTSTAPLFERAINIVGTGVMRGRLNGFNAVRIQKTTLTNAAPEANGSLAKQMGCAQDRASDLSQAPAAKKLKLENDVDAVESDSNQIPDIPVRDVDMCGSSPVKMLKEEEEASDEYDGGDTQPQHTMLSPGNIKLEAEDSNDLENTERFSETPDDGGKSERLAMERETGTAKTINDARKCRVFFTNKDGQVSEKDVAIKVLRRKTEVADNRTEPTPPKTKNVPISNLEKLLEVDDVHKPCEWCCRVLSPTMLRVHKTEHAEFGICGVTHQTYKCPYRMCTGERELDSLDQFCLHLLFQHYQPAGIYEKVFYTHQEFFEWIYRFQERGDYHCVANHPGQRDTRVRVKQFRCIYTKPSRCATMPDFPDSDIMYEIPKTTCRYIPRGHICSSFYTQYVYPDGTVKIRYCSCHLHDTVSPAVPSVVRQRARELHVMGVDARMMHYNLIPEHNDAYTQFSWITGVIRGLSDQAIMSMLDFLKENPRQRSDFLTKDNFDKLIFPVLNFGIDYGNERDQGNGPRPAPNVRQKQKTRCGVRRKYSIFHPTGKLPFPGNPLLEDEIDKINKLGNLYLLNKDLEGFRYYVEVVDKLADYLDFDGDEPPHFLVNKRKPPCYVPKFPVDPKRQKRARGRPRKYPLPRFPSEYVTSCPNSDDVNIFDQSRDSRSLSYGLASDSTALLPESGTLADVLGVYAERVVKSERRSSNSDYRSASEDTFDRMINPGTLRNVVELRTRTACTEFSLISIHCNSTTIFRGIVHGLSKATSTREIKREHREGRK